MRVIFAALYFSFLPLANAETIEFPGTYRVPVTEQLTEFALFPLPSVSVDKTDSQVKIQFALPAELTGHPLPVTLEGPRNLTGPLILTGPYGRMECPAADDLSECAVSYASVPFDQAARDSFLKSISKSQDELRKRQLVAERFQFGGEPHGILHVEDQPFIEGCY